MPQPQPKPNASNSVIVYIVEFHWYSETTVQGVFATRAAAEKWVEDNKAMITLPTMSHTIEQWFVQN